MKKTKLITYVSTFRLCIKNHRVSMQILSLSVLFTLLSGNSVASNAIAAQLQAINCATDSPICSLTVGPTITGYLDLTRPINNPDGGTNDCQTGATQYKYVFDSSNSEGKNILSLAITARVADLKINVIGTGHCYRVSNFNNITGSSEYIKYFHLN